MVKLRSVEKFVVRHYGKSIGACLFVCLFANQCGGDGECDGEGRVTLGQGSSPQRG